MKKKLEKIEEHEILAGKIVEISRKHLKSQKDDLDFQYFYSDIVDLFEAEKAKGKAKEHDKIETIREGIQTIRDVMDETGFVDPDINETLNTIDSLLTDLEAEH